MVRREVTKGWKTMSDLKKSKIENRCKHEIHGTDCFECYPKPVDEGLDEAANNYCEGNSLGAIAKRLAFTRGASYQAPISEAIGEARGWRDAIEAIRDMNPFVRDHLKEEAKRRGIKL